MGYQMPVPEGVGVDYILQMEFTLTSDDGSLLFLDNEERIDDSGAGSSFPRAFLFPVEHAAL